MRLHYLALAPAIVALAACGGGGGASPIPHPTATPTVAPTKAPAKRTVAFTVGKPGAKAAVRRFDTCPSITPPELTAQAFSDYVPPANSLAAFAWIYESVSATEYDASCNVISSTPTYTSTGPLTQTQPALVAGTAAAGSFFGTSAGAGTVTATFPDGTSGTIPAGSYDVLSLTCSSLSWLGGTPSFSASGSTSSPDALAVSAPVDAPKCANYQPVTGPYTLPDGSTFSGTGIVFPYGYEVVSGGSVYALAEQTSVGTFVSAGYAITYQQLAALGQDVIIFGTSTGAYVKLGILSSGCGESATIYNCGDAGHLVGLVSTASSGGTFAY